MKLKDCTKEELIFVIGRLQLHGLTAGDYYINRALRDVEERRESQKTEEAKRLSKLANEKHLEYMKLISPYIGQPIASIPDEIIEKADAAQKECETANLRWFKLMGIKIKK